VASAIGAVVTLIFFALVLTTAYVTYMVYFKGVTHFEDISTANLVGDKLNATKASERKEGDLENEAALEGESNQSGKSGEEEVDQDSSRTPVKGGVGQQRPRPNA
jgi:anionic cell wall polymer biosynthesis LytR-Cps2A-Psr (LCP) family protein